MNAALYKWRESDGCSIAERFGRCSSHHAETLREKQIKENHLGRAHPLPSFLHPGIFDVVIHVDPPPNPSEYFSRSLIATLYSFVLLAVVQRDLWFCSCLGVFGLSCTWMWLSWRRYRDILDISGPCLFLRQQCI